MNPDNFDFLGGTGDHAHSSHLDSQWDNPHAPPSGYAPAQYFPPINVELQQENQLETDPGFLKHSTISRDHTEGSNIDQEKLAALDRSRQIGQTPLDHYPYAPPPQHHPYPLPPQDPFAQHVAAQVGYQSSPRPRRANPEKEEERQRNDGVYIVRGARQRQHGNSVIATTKSSTRYRIPRGEDPDVHSDTYERVGQLYTEVDDLPQHSSARPSKDIITRGGHPADGKEEIPKAGAQTRHLISNCCPCGSHVVEHNILPHAAPPHPQESHAEAARLRTLSKREPSKNDYQCDPVDLYDSDADRCRARLRNSEHGLDRARGMHLENPEADYPKASPMDASVQELLYQINALRRENLSLRNRLENEAIDAGQRFPIPPTWRTFYSLDEQFYLSEPEWGIDEKNEPFLQTKSRLRDFQSYLEKHEEVAFVIIKDYQSSVLEGVYDDILPTPKPSGERLGFTSEDMQEAVKCLIDQDPEFSRAFPGFCVAQRIPAPYLFIYYLTPKWSEHLHRLSKLHRSLLNMLWDAVKDSYGQEYYEAESFFGGGQIKRRLMNYLVKPGDVLVGKKDDLTVAYIASSWASEGDTANPVKPRNQAPAPCTTSYEDHIADIKILQKQLVNPWVVKAWCWIFDGSFQREYVDLNIPFPSSEADDVINVTELDYYPLKFASDNIRSQLEQRGRMFWKCRIRKYVSHTAQGDGMDERFMIDPETYRKLHPDSVKKKGTLRDDLGLQAMAQDDPPKGNLLLVFPPAIVGYNLRIKKWVDIHVDMISDVSWNKDAFKSLVVGDEMRELLEALVTNQIAVEKATDLISGKGNGLIILLHGGPGTGKTFTAESVAEFAEKPLYRVTCGDIGTKPEDVEKYLESVLHLGKIWKCVVLLDEADVFLEERGLTDLERNALVSVFLRVLEYYDGILILTSNRVGLFDEAFKSRIQLALHYSPLGQGERRQIWENFIKRLKLLKESAVDFDNLEDNIDKLAKEDMNGRQIRNAITTARQLAQYRREDFAYRHLERAIAIASKFEEYLKDVRGGNSDECLAREDGRR